MGERDKKRQAEMSALWGASYLSLVSLHATKGRRQVADIVKRSYRIEEKALVVHFQETKKWRSMSSTSAQNAKISALAMRKLLRLRIHLLGEEGRKKAYPSSHNGSNYKEMTYHKRSMQPSMINNERRSLEALNQYKSKTFCIFFSSLACA